MKVTINNKEIELKIGFRAFMLYEQITEKTYSPESLSDIIMFFYSVVYSSDKSKSITFDEFLDWLDEHPESMEEFNTALEVYTTRGKDVERVEETPTQEQIEQVKKN